MRMPCGALWPWASAHQIKLSGLSVAKAGIIQPQPAYFDPCTSPRILLPLADRMLHEADAATLLSPVRWLCSGGNSKIHGIWAARRPEEGAQ
jgi:hypothetical protein